MISIELADEWLILRNSGIFEWFLSPNYQWSDIIYNTISLSEKYPMSVLSALFQISGVCLPLRLGVNSNKVLVNELLDKAQSGAVIAAHCLTEPSGGTDIFSMKTMAEQNENFWVVNGEKSYISNGSIADLGLLYTNTEGYQEKVPYNISCFLLDMKKKGVCSGAPLEKIGLNEMPICSIHLDKVQLNEHELIVGPQFGYHVVHMSTTFERLLIPLAFIGIMRNLYKEAPSYSRTEIYKHIFVAESLVKNALAEVNLMKWQRHYIKLGCLLKWHLSESYIKVAKLSGSETAYRDALSSWIYSGANDALRAALWKLI